MSSNIRIQRICKECGREFTARTTVTQFCGNNCAKRNYKIRVRQGNIERSEAETERTRQKPLEDIRQREFLSIAEAAVLVGVSRWTLHRAIVSGAVQSAKLGRRRIIRRESIESLFSRET